MTATGSEADLMAFLAAEMATEEPWSPECGELPDLARGSDGNSMVCLTFPTNWKGAFKEMLAASARHPSLVITLAAAELANCYAEANVMRAGGIIGGYSMQPEEINQATGPDYDEEPVFDDLFSTVSSYEFDALDGGTAPKVG